MSVLRPFLDKSADELRELAKGASLSNLREIRTELTFRSSSKAQSVIAEIDKKIDEMVGDQFGGKVDDTRQDSGAGDSIGSKGRIRHELNDAISVYTAKQIAQLRQRLLDLSASNSLLNYRFRDSARAQLRIIDELPDQLHARIQNQQKMWFLAITEPDGVPKDELTEEFQLALEAARLSDDVYLHDIAELGDEDPENPKFRQLERDLRDRVREAFGLPPRPSRKTLSRAEIARAQGLSPSYELPINRGCDPKESRHDDDNIQTLLFPDEMGRKLSFLREQTRRGLEETGLNTLFAAYGFLEWYDTEGSGRTFLAPLLLQPLEIERVTKAHEYRYSIAGSGEETEGNLTLIEKMKQFSIAFPELDESDTPESYFAKVAEAIKSKRDWRVRRFAVIGTFAFGKLALWHDLNPAKWPQAKAPQTHPVVSDLLAGTGGSSGASAAEYPVDSPEFDGRMPLLITDADASQLSAIIDGIEGRSLAIKGPPGTGKSQTITNLIAAAMHQGKSVLFVAEKMAALDVVKKRLDSFGLGDFVLELHSTKARKQDLFASLKARLDLKKDFPFPAKLEDTAAELRRVRTQLTNYVDLLNSKAGRCGKTVQEVLWADARTKTVGLPAKIADVNFENAHELSEPDLQRCRRVLGAFEKVSKELLLSCGERSRNPWHGVGRILPLFEQEELIRAVRSWRATQQELFAALSRLPESASLTVSKSSATLSSSVVGFDEALVELQGRVPQNFENRILKEIAPSTSFANAMNLHRLWTELADVEALLASAFEETANLRAEELGAMHAMAQQIGASDIAASALPSHKEGLEGRRREWIAIAEFVDEAFRLTMSVGQKSAEAIRLLDGVFRHVTNARPEIRNARLPGLGREGIEGIIAEAKQTAGRLKLAQQMLSKLVEVDDRHGTDAVREAGETLEISGLFQYLFSSRCRAARKLYRELATKRGGSRKTHGATLRDLADHLADVSKFSDSTKYADALGDVFKGIETDFEHLEEVRRYLLMGQKVTLGHEIGARLYAFVADAGSSSVDAFVLLSKQPEAAWLAKAVQVLQDSKAQGPVDLVAQLEAHIVRCCELSEAVRRAMLRRQTSFNELPAAILKLQKREEIRRELSVNEDMVRRLEALGVEQVSGRTALATAIEFVECVSSAFASLPTADWSALILDGHVPDGLLELRSAAKGVTQALEAHENAANTVVELATLDPRQAFGAPLQDVSLEALDRWIGEALESSEALAKWADWLRARSEVEDEKLLKVIEPYSDGHPIENLEAAFDRIVWRSLIRRAFRQNPELNRLSGLKMEDARKQFRVLDRRVQQFKRQEIAASLRRRAVSPGIGTGPKSGFSDVALINHHVSLQRSSLAIRKLIDRAHGALKSLKPCWMMSPGSIAQFLPQGGVEFDLVVIDEASQMKPQEAIGAAARGKQIIVVGDPMQLPPTSFFDTATIFDDDDDEDGDEIQAESVLDLALSAYQPSRDLMWHYRSRHESLIAFSNEQFYEGKLIVFPSPEGRSNELGVNWRPVEGKYKGKGLNILEVEAVADAALSHMRMRPEESLGVVAVNAAQAELLRSEIDRLILQDEAAQTYVGKWEATIESFFVKNLESVQGDERDVIMISTVYGKDDNGAMFQRFGPINSSYGHRRLNVLFTRAKRRVDVFSSMAANDIVIGDTTRRGVKALRGYLEYAATGRLMGGDPLGGEPESDFELFVADALKARGYQVRAQVGVAGFRIDLGVMHPEWPHGFLLGIECDGATYHSAKSARDRDALRQEILEGLGWKLYRIWSTDWFNNPRGETEKMIQHIEGIRITRPN